MGKTIKDPQTAKRNQERRRKSTPNDIGYRMLTPVTQEYTFFNHTHKTQSTFQGRGSRWGRHKCPPVVGGNVGGAFGDQHLFQNNTNKGFHKSS